MAKSRGQSLEEKKAQMKPKYTKKGKLNYTKRPQTSFFKFKVITLSFLEPKNVVKSQVLLNLEELGRFSGP